MQYKNRNRTFCKAWNRLQRYLWGIVPIFRARIGLKHFHKTIEKVWDIRDIKVFILIRIRYILAIE